MDTSSGAEEQSYSIVHLSSKILLGTSSGAVEQSYSLVQLSSKLPREAAVQREVSRRAAAGMQRE